MNLSGTTNTSSILTNSQFYLSGLSQTNLSTINITDKNGLDVSQCFGITTKIVNVNSDAISSSGACDTSLEITITSGVNKEITCDFTGFTQIQDSGLILFEYDGRTSLNTHPDCCTSLGYEPEIGPENYYVCRWREEIDPTDCVNYEATGQFNGSDYMIFNFITGGTVTAVPSAECCYTAGLVETSVNGTLYCIEDIPFDPCSEYQVIEPTPIAGDITFLNTNTNTNTTIVPTSECCTSLGFNFRTNGEGFTCFNTIGDDVTLTITNDTCCLEQTTSSTDTSGGGDTSSQVTPIDRCCIWTFDALNTSTTFEVNYLDCNGRPSYQLITNGVITAFIIYSINVTSSLGNVEISDSEGINVQQYNGADYIIEPFNCEGANNLV